ncbi:partitioning defective 3 homolog B isoform X3 [Salmo salar]|uniref:Partitioning defective 3 homolog B isoform X3 n=1 Tax=Salmo salar TaxID=8030 RepID=A0ABM3DYD8_SALSA|nr:partitioning defective 3 homolog B-like isoform X3 [Salmo salar]
MKVTVTFGQTSVVVPCKEGWKVRELIQQATQRYRKLLEQEGNFLVRTHHVEYCDGGILDPDDVLTDLVEDRDKLMAVYEEQEAQRRGAVSPRGGVTGRPSQDPYDAEVSVFQPIRGGEIEVNSSALQSNTPLLVRSSSESTLSPLVEMLQPTQPQEPNDRPGPEPPTGVNHGLEKTGGHRADVSTTKLNTFSLSSLTKTVEISGEHGPLGIHVVPYVSSLSGRALGLHIRGVEENSRSKREGIFQDDECIVKINETELMDKSFTQAQEVFRYAMRSPMVRLEVVPVSNRERYEKSLIGQLFNQSGSPKATLKTSSKEPPSIKPAVKPYDSPTARMAEDSISLEGRPMGSPHLAHPVPVSLSPVPKEKSDSPLLKRSPTFSTLVGFTSKKGGKRLKIDLKKGPEGLGFTVVTRDSSVHGPGPILVKNILPRGAAVKDGRLQSGDRILEVNGVDISRRSQEDLVSMLRSTRQGESVVLLVARQEDVFLPRELKEEEARAVLLSEEGKEQLMFEVPLNDTGSAGLGISLKGNKSRETGEDLGIFIKSIIHGGAAYKDGHLRGNDQLIAVNGESLLGKSNHEAMETLRRSMSMEGNLRGMIQLVVLRALVKSEDPFVPSNQSFDASISCPARSANTSAQQPVVNNTIYERSNVFNGSSVHVGEEDDEEELNLISPRQEGLSPAPGESSTRPISGPAPGESSTRPIPGPAPGESSTRPIPGPAPGESSTRPIPGPAPGESSTRPIPGPAPGESSTRPIPGPVPGESSTRPIPGPAPGESSTRPIPGPQPAQFQYHHTKSSKSMDLEPSPAVDLGPTLGLKKSSSLESLQTAMSEVRKNEPLPFHRPRPHMVRGRGCNESFRAAIDKSYDGPADEDDDDLSEQSSGRDTPASGSSRQGVGEATEERKDKKQKVKGMKKDKQSKSKGKKMSEDEPDKKTKKKKGFGLLRFGKKKNEKVKKSEAKATLQRQKSEVLSEEELDRMKDERERIEAKHAELRERQARDKGLFPDVEDDYMDPNYARINNFRDSSSPRQSPYSRLRTPSPQRPPPHGLGPGSSHGNEPSNKDPLDGLYAKVNKQRQAPPMADSSVDRIQQLRREYQQVCREGAAPVYEEIENRQRGPEYNQHKMPVRVAGPGPDHRLAPRYEEVERQYASLPRRGPMDPSEGYAIQQPGWVGHYPGPQPSYPNPNYPPRGDPNYPPRGDPNYPPRGDPNYPPRGDPNYPPRVDPRQADPGYYHPPPLRQDVPPSPTLPLRAPRYDTMNRGGGGGGGGGGRGGGGGGYRQASPERYAYGVEGPARHHDPRQKNPMTAAV